MVKDEQRATNGFRLLDSRRNFLSTLALGAAAFTMPGAFAAELIKTPAQTEGPFYPNKLPLDTDNDLIVINESLTPAVGEITYLSGRILNSRESRYEARWLRFGRLTRTAPTSTPRAITMPSATPTFRD